MFKNGPAVSVFSQNKKRNLLLFRPVGPELITDAGKPGTSAPVGQRLVLLVAHFNFSGPNIWEILKLSCCLCTVRTLKETPPVV